MMSNSPAIFHPNNLEKLDKESCFNSFDKNTKNKLNFDDFLTLCKALFHNSQGVSYDLEELEIKEIFSIFDKNEDNYLDRNEFQFCWEKWISVVIKPKSALLVVDVQNDFITGKVFFSIPRPHKALLFLVNCEKMYKCMGYMSYTSIKVMKILVQE